MKQINPLAIHSESLYRMADFQAQAVRDKLALETKRSYPETSGQRQGQQDQRGWLNQKLAQFRGLALLNRVK
jgi:hypothetical protein